MKNMFESASTFEIYARIGAAYFLLGKIKEEMVKPVSGINAMIDKATGFDKVKDKEHITAIIDLLEGMIKDKKLIGADYTGDFEMLNEAKKAIKLI